MAYFAKINKKNNTVLQVIRVQNDKILVDGVESEDKGIEFCNKLFKDDSVYFKQTSYNENIRYNYAAIGDVYDKENEAFIKPKPVGKLIKIEDVVIKGKAEKLASELDGDWQLNSNFKWQFAEVAKQVARTKRVVENEPVSFINKIVNIFKKPVYSQNKMEKYTDSYFKYFFSRFEHWGIISIMILIMLGAYLQTKDNACFIFIIPILVMVARSIKMYKQKKNGTTS